MTTSKPFPFYANTKKGMFFRNVQDIGSIIMFKKRKSLGNQEIFVENKCIIQKKN